MRCVQGMAPTPSSPSRTPEQIAALDAVKTPRMQARAHGRRAARRPWPSSTTGPCCTRAPHSRDDDEHVRYLVRIWLRNEDPALAWPVPAIFRMGHDKIFSEDDEDGEPLKWNVTLQPRLMFKVHQTLAQA